jgi:anti-sigma B factor antagonist
MGHQAVVSLPEHIDVSNAGQIREELLSVINRGAAVLIADMTATVSCDRAGADAVARAFQRAVVNGTQLRLVVTAPVVRHVLGIEGLDRLVSIYPSLEAAIAAGAPAAEVPVEPGLAKTEADDQAPRRRVHGQGASNKMLANGFAEAVASESFTSDRETRCIFAELLICRWPSTRTRRSTQEIRMFASSLPRPSTKMASTCSAWRWVHRAAPIVTRHTTS